MHRDHMEAQMEEYDWFMYAEEDTFVPWQALYSHVQLAEKVYEHSGRILSFLRLVNDSSGRFAVFFL